MNQPGAKVRAKCGGEERMSASHTGLTSAAAAEAPAPDFPWLAHYPPNVPATIDVDKAGSLADMFRDSVARHADRPALESFGKRLTYAELGAAATAVASWLQARGLRKGDRVALMMPNVAAYPASIYGVLLAGGVVVNVNPLYTARELSHQLNDSGAADADGAGELRPHGRAGAALRDARRRRGGAPRRPARPQGQGRRPRLPLREEIRGAFQPARHGLRSRR